MARATYYYHKKRLDAADKYAAVKMRIKYLFDLHKGRYGYRRITQTLRNEGHKINHKTVEKLMRLLGLKCTIRKVRYRSYKGQIGRIAPNVIERDFKCSGPNQKWATDVTQINIKGDKCYLSPILDMFNGEIISYTLSLSPNLNMVMGMLEKAFAKVKDTYGLLIHSDQGWHYQHLAYRNELKNKGVIQSMSRKGNCLDNAMMENFFGIMKTELLYRKEFGSIEQFKNELMQYIHYYNNERIKLRLNGKSPVQYRTLSII